MQEKEKLYRLAEFYHATLLVNKPSWLKYYCLCCNESVLHVANLTRRTLFSFNNKDLKNIKEHYNKFEMLDDKIIHKEYLAWKGLLWK